MDDAIELVSDGEGVAVIGSSTAVERFLSASGLSTFARDASRLPSVLSAGGTVAQVGAELASQSGRWVKLTQESAAKIGQYGLTPTKTPGVSHAMVGPRGSIKNWIQIETGPGALMSNPAVLSGAAGIMAQLAMQQAMDEIMDYLARIDEKLDDVLRAQTNQVLARMDGVALAVKEATTIRDTVGRVSEVTWSKVQSSSTAILETQGYALRQLSDLTEKLEHQSKVGDLAKTARQAEVDVPKWLTVLARCFQLHDAVAVIELDRVLDSSPDELDRHRLGLQAARRDRVDLIATSTEQLVARMQAAAATANSKVLFNPMQSPAIVDASNRVTSEVHELHQVLALEYGQQSSEARRWKEAAGERWGQAREASADGVDTIKRLGDKTLGQARQTGAEGVDTIKRLSDKTFGQAGSMKDKLAGRFPGGKRRRSEHEDDTA